MGLPRLQFRIRTLAGVVALSALGLGCLRAHGDVSGPTRGPGYRIASEVVGSWRARPRPATRTTVDPLTLVGVVATTFVALRWKHSRRA